MRERVLVTGGAGFIGSHLCDALLASGHSVICLDNLATGAESNIAHLKKNPQFCFMEHNICASFSLDVGRIYHLASPASPVAYQNYPIETTVTNVLGTKNVLDVAKENKALILLASTSEVYGDPLIHPQQENYRGNVNPIGVRACYNEAKRCAESLFFDYHRHYGVGIRVARIFNTYGPRMQCDDGRVISNFITQALKGEDITIFGTGGQTRSFCYISDMVAGLTGLMECPDRLFQGPVNLGFPKEISILELAELVRKHTGARSNIVYQPLPKDDPVKRLPDISLAQQRLGWTPKVGLDEGISHTQAYFSAVLSG